MGATLMLMRNTTDARPLFLLPFRTTAARAVVQLLLLLPRHTTAAKYHTVAPSLASAPPDLPVPKPTVDDQSMRVRGGRHSRN